MKAGQNTQLAHLSVYTHQQWPTLCMSTFASPIVWVRMSKSDCIVYLLNMHFSLSGCSIEGRTPSTSASVCGGSACMKPRAHMGRWQCGFYHARAYCSIPLWCTALRCLWTFFDESVRKFSIVPGHSTNSGWTARQFRAAKLVVSAENISSHWFGWLLGCWSFWFHFISMTFAQCVRVHRQSSIVQAKLVASSFWHYCGLDAGLAMAVVSGAWTGHAWHTWI